MSNAPPKPPGTVNWFAVSAVLAVVLVAGAAGAYSMQATDQAAFCGSCHVMSEVAWTHKQSAHAKLACNECHAPSDLAAKIDPAPAGSPLTFRKGGPGSAIQANFPLGGLQQAQDRPGQRGLACAALTHHAPGFPPLDLEGEASQHPAVPSPHTQIDHLQEVGDRHRPHAAVEGVDQDGERADRSWSLFLALQKLVRPSHT